MMFSILLSVYKNEKDIHLNEQQDEDDVIGDFADIANLNYKEDEKESEEKLSTTKSVFFDE